MNDLSHLTAEKRLRRWIDEFQRVEADTTALSSNEEAVALAAMSEDEVQAALRSLGCDLRRKERTRSVLGLAADGPSVLAGSGPRAPASVRPPPPRQRPARPGLGGGAARVRMGRYVAWATIAAVLVVGVMSPIGIFSDFRLKQSVDRLSAQVRSLHDNLGATSDRVNLLETERSAAATSPALLPADGDRNQELRRELGIVSDRLAEVERMQRRTSEREARGTSSLRAPRPASEAAQHWNAAIQMTGIDRFTVQPNPAADLSDYFRPTKLPMLTAIK